MPDCVNCTERCPQAELANEIAKGRMYATKEFIRAQKELESKKSMNDWAAEIHQNAVDHGWWDKHRSFGDIVALCHSELSEALEEYRNGKPSVYCAGISNNAACMEDKGGSCIGIECLRHSPNRKPEGIAVEMIDCMIRILDWCGKEGVDVDAVLKAKHEYNKTRPYRHGGKVL